MDERPSSPGHDTTASSRTRAPGSFKRMLGGTRVDKSLGPESARRGRGAIESDEAIEWRSDADVAKPQTASGNEESFNRLPRPLAGCPERILQDKAPRESVIARRKRPVADRWNGRITAFTYAFASFCN